MNDGNTHWYLCVIDMMEKEARVYDTLPRSRLNQKRLNDVKHMVFRLEICYSFNVLSSNYFLPYICLCYHHPQMTYLSYLFKDSTFTSLFGKPMCGLDECKVVVPERVPLQANGYDSISLLYLVM